MSLIQRFIERRKVRRRLQEVIRQAIEERQDCELCGRRLYGPGVRAVELGPSGLRDIVICISCAKDPVTSIFTAAAERQLAPQHPVGSAHPTGPRLLGDGPNACPAGHLPPVGTF
jgi:hypothetical protein